MSHHLSVTGSMDDLCGPARQGPWASTPGSADDDVLFACAALVLSGRLTKLSATDAIEYLYLIADDIGIDNVSLARLIVEAAEGRAASLN